MLRLCVKSFIWLGLLTLLIVGSSHVTASARHEEKPLFTRLIGSHTLMFVHIRVGEYLQMPMVKGVLDNMQDVRAEAEKGIRQALGVGLTDLETATIYVDQPRVVNGDVHEPREPYFIFQTKKEIQLDALKSAIGERQNVVKFGKYDVMVGDKLAVSLLDSKTMLMIVMQDRRREMIQQDWLLHFASLDAENELPDGLKESAALASASKHILVSGFHIPKELGTVLQDKLKQAPAAMAPFKSLAQVQSGVITADYLPNSENDFQMVCRARFSEEGQAKAGMGAIRFAIAAGKMAMTSSPASNDPEIKEAFMLANKQLDAIKTEVKQSELHISYGMNSKLMIPLLASAIERVRNAADRMISGSNMRQLLIAMHNYHNDYNFIPPAVSMKDGKSLHSWRVHILPYIEQDQLYKQLKMDEPWDSDHNKKLFESVPMPKMFAHPGKRDGDTKKTYYKVFVSKPEKQLRSGFRFGSKVTLGQVAVQDGTSNTIAMIESGPPVLWYQPEDIEFDATVALPKLISPWKNNKVSVTFFDGTVRTIWLGQNEAVLKALITVNGNEEIDISKLENEEKK
ncbi:MAG: DUF1559 domain-containing protein [Planctomycetia bacterium]|nr:DUF1559 domain-containing protein [Planctomycetia bacterium]